MGDAAVEDGTKGFENKSKEGRHESELSER